MALKNDLSIKFCGVNFENPLMLSSSNVSNTGEMVGRAFDAGWGGAVFKTLGAGSEEIIHPSPRMSHYIYKNKFVGLQNHEQISDRPLDMNLKDFRYLKKNWPDKVLVSSIMGFSKDEWKLLAKSSEDNGANMLELNFSCPHMTVEGSGMKVGQAFQLVEEYTSIVKKEVKIPVLAKLTPNVTDIHEQAMFAKNGGADGIAAINTVSGLIGVDLDTFSPRLNAWGKGAISGFSGPAIKPIGLKCISEMGSSDELSLPLSGCGGIETWQDALEYIVCGATTVQVTTAIIQNGYRVIKRILQGIDKYMTAKKIKSISELVGRALPNIVTTNDLDLDRQGIAVFDMERCENCKKCLVSCEDSAGKCLSWDKSKKIPVMDTDKCLGCMVCSFVCPVDDPPMITFKEIPGRKSVIMPAVE